MKPSDFQNRMPGYYKSSSAIYIKSPPGRGKSTIINEGVPVIGKKLGMSLGLSYVNCTLLTPADTVGYLVPTKREGADGKQHIDSKFTSPFWWVTQEGKRLEEYDGGIIFLDEMDKADQDVKKVLGEMMLSGSCGPHTLPKGWVVWAAGNRAVDRSGSTRELDHLINRRKEIELTDDIQSLEAWMSKSGVAPEIIAFAAGNPEVVFQEKPKEQQPWCTPRSLVMAGQDLEVFRDERGLLPEDPLAIEETSGRIGTAASSALFAMIRLSHEMPDFADICRLPDKVKVPTKPDAQMLVAYNLAHRVDASTLDPVIIYMQRMPKEFAITFAKSAIRRSPMLVIEDAMERWAEQNGTLMSAIVNVK